MELNLIPVAVYSNEVEIMHYKHYDSLQSVPLYSSGRPVKEIWLWKTVCTNGCFSALCGNADNVKVELSS